jgi:hypothetical protein
MPIVLDTQKVIRGVRALPFCYLCGVYFDRTEKPNLDHVPPSGLFAVTDRDFPIILPTHPTCNAKQSRDDQVVGQLVGLVHGRRPSAIHRKFRVSLGRFENSSPAFAVGGLDLRLIIRRWIRGFHAALYSEYLPEGTLFSTCPPLPEAEPATDGPKFRPVMEAIPEFVKEVKRNRATGTLDRIVCRNGKFRYECVWSQADNGIRMCIYGLDLYRWINLGDTTNFEPRGCVGSYIRSGGGVPCGGNLHDGIGIYSREPCPARSIRQLKRTLTEGP